MADEIDTDIEDDTPATNEELLSLVKAQAGRINELESDAQTHAGLKDEVAKLKESLDTTTSMNDVFDKIKAMYESKPGQTKVQKQAQALQDAADNGDMKEFRRLRSQSA